MNLAPGSILSVRVTWCCCTTQVNTTYSSSTGVSTLSISNTNHKHLDAVKEAQYPCDVLAAPTKLQKQINQSMLHL